MGLRNIAKCKPVREKGKGWGLVPLQNVAEGSFVQEYVGDVIDEAEKESRLLEWSKNHPNDPNFYVMYLDTRWYIDARVTANLSRFVNHSCAPNCKLKRVNVNGYMRVGIFAIRDIKAGEFLSYDYQFDTKHGDKFICRCGAENCRGTMKGGKQAKVEEKLSKADEWVKAKAEFDRDLKYLEEVERVEQEKATQVGIMVPSYDFSNELVSNGPDKGRSDLGDNNKLFLWRNAILGSKFSDRDHRRNNRKARSENFDHKEPAKIDVLSILKEYNPSS